MAIIQSVTRNSAQARDRYRGAAVQSTWIIALICVVQWALAVRPGLDATPFEDEGLYIFMGHRMIEHLFHGSFLSEYPGAYFSGAPGFYPVLAAIGDSIAGIRGARMVSLLFAIAATVAVNGLGRELYGRTAGLVGAAAFVLCGSVVFQSALATFDSTMLFFVAASSWLTVSSVRRNQFLWAPVVGLLLVLACYAKYAGVIYVPIVAGLAIVTATPESRPLVVRRTLFMLTSAVIVGYFIFALWGQSLAGGITSTTTSRNIISPASATVLLQQVGRWIGPWLVTAAAGAVLARRTWPVAVVLLAGSVIGPLGQIRIGEATSLAKHVAFGMIFAAPLIGLLIATTLKPLTWKAIPAVVLILAAFAASGLHYSHEFLTGWVSDANLVGPLNRLSSLAPGKPVLGEQPSPERYALRQTTLPQQWIDTYAFSYANRTGVDAYKLAISETSFGVIYLARQRYGGGMGSPTRNGDALYGYLETSSTPYRLVGRVDRVLRGQLVGYWYLYVPKVVANANHL